MSTMDFKQTIGRRIEDYRKKEGMSQADLAQKMEGLSKSSIEKFEKGEMAPSPQNLKRLAEVLNVMEEDLVRPYILEIDYDVIRYRKRSKLPKKVIAAIQRKYGIMLERYIEIEMIMEDRVLFPFDYSDMPVSSPQDARRVARRFRSDMGWDDRPIVAPICQLEKKGVKVFTLDPTESENKDFDGMCYREGNLAVVVVKKCENTEHDRFTLFHEMGHLLMNTGDIQGRELERLCHAFASEMLIPENRFKVLFPKGRIYRDTLKMIQREWGISCDAQLYKARDLGMITKNNFISYCVQKNRNSSLKQEMEQSRFEAEQGCRFETLVMQAWQDFRVTGAKAASLLGCTLDELNIKYQSVNG